MIRDFSQLTELVDELKQIVKRMHDRGEHVPFELEEKIHLIEQETADHAVAIGAAAQRSRQRNRRDTSQ